MTIPSFLLSLFETTRDKEDPIKKAATKLAVITLILSISVTRGSEIDRLKTRFENALEQVTNYQVTMIYEQTDGIHIERRTVRFSYRDPGWVRNDILEGKDEGSIAVYDPYRFVVYAKRSWMPLPLTLDPDNRLVTTLRGNRINEASFPAMLARWEWFEDNGDISSVGTENFENRNCSIIDFTTSGSSAIRGVSREVWWLDSSTGFPIKIVSYDPEGNMVQWLLLRGLLLNPGLGPDYFRL